MICTRRLARNLFRTSIVGLLIFLGGCSIFQPGRPIATIRLHNPTLSTEPAIVEIPVGHLAAPNLVDWQNVQLRHEGELIPFALREGKARWKAGLNAPVKNPRAEDLLVFALPVSPNEWSELEVQKGSNDIRSALKRVNGSLVVEYEDFKATIDERSGRLTGLEAFGESLLDRSLNVALFQVEPTVVEHEKNMGPSYSRRPATIQKSRDLPPPPAKLVSWSSTIPLTEINFVIQPESGPSVALTYRFYANKQVEILADERPWQGASPWLTHGFKFQLALNGEREELRDFQTHFPLYGFKDYPAAVKSVGTLHQGTKTLTFELGEESVNGRFWQRKLAVFAKAGRTKTQDLLALLDQGLVVEVTPMCQALPKNIWLTFSPDAKSVGDLLADGLTKAGFRVTTGNQVTTDPTVVVALNLMSKPTKRGISGDGFSIQPQENGLEISAGTKFGLFKGASEVIQSLKGSATTRDVPLIAENPVVDFRGGGFGGAGHEVDFPLGSDSDWEQAFDGMIASGMNVMTDLGMWSNWKMPVFFKYMPELQSNSAQAYDEVTGANFGQFEEHRAHGLKLLNYLQARGVKVWLWLPVGAIPTTFKEKFPAATVPGNDKTPRFMHPKYRQLLMAYFKELLEVYPVDGFVLIRDDNGGIDGTPEFKEYVATSRTKHPVWEQYLVMYEILRSLGFRGQIAVYPYFDVYEPRLEASLPQDLLLVGHGSGLGMLTRNFELVGPMGDTWLDNLYTSFRLPTSSRMKRLLADRSSYWIGGAYCGTELPWEAVGYFGWQPTASVNTFRHEFGKRHFGPENALKFLAFSDAYERLWEIMNVPLLPYNWFSFTEKEREKIAEESRHGLSVYQQRLNQLQATTTNEANRKWFAHVNHYATFFHYYFRRLENLGQMHDLAAVNRSAVHDRQPLPEPLRQKLIAMQKEVLMLARNYEQEAVNVPGNMMADTRKMKITTPFNELFYAGFDRSLDDAPGAKVKQFDGTIRVKTPVLTPGEPFELEIELQNLGCIPWIEDAGNDLVLEGETKAFDLPGRWDFEGEPMVFGDRRIVRLRGKAPEKMRTVKIKLNFVTSYRGWTPFSQTVELK